MNKTLNSQQDSRSLNFSCKSNTSLDKGFRKDEIKAHASALAKENVEKRFGKPN